MTGTTVTVRAGDTKPSVNNNGTKQRATVSAIATTKKADDPVFYYSTDVNGSFGDSNVPEFTDAAELFRILGEA